MSEKCRICKKKVEIGIKHEKYRKTYNLPLNQRGFQLSLNFEDIIENKTETPSVQAAGNKKRTKSLKG